MDEIIKFALATLGTNALLAFLIWFFFHLWFKTWVERDVEKFKADLQRRVFEHEIRFRRIDDKIAEHLVGIYQRLYLFYEAAHSYVQMVENSEAPSKQEQLEAVRATDKEFYDYLLMNRPYVPPSLFKRVRGVSDRMRDIVSKMTLGIRREGRRDSDSDRDPWWEAVEAMDGEVKGLYSDLVAAIQTHLGVGDGK